MQLWALCLEPRGKGKGLGSLRWSLGIRLWRTKTVSFCWQPFVITWGLQTLNKYSFNHVALQFCPQNKGAPTQTTAQSLCSICNASQGRGVGSFVRFQQCLGENTCHGFIPCCSKLVPHTGRMQDYCCARLVRRWCHRGVECTSKERSSSMFYWGKIIIWQGSISLMEFNKVLIVLSHCKFHLINYCMEETYKGKLS